MTPQEFVEWGRRIADEYAQRLDPSTAYQRGHEFDEGQMAADEFLSKSNSMARAFTVPGGQEKLALTPELLQLQRGDGEANFERVYQLLRPALWEILEGMWLGEWQLNDSGLAGTLKIDRQSSPGTDPFQAVYLDSQGTVHETVVTQDDEEYGMSYESLHIEVKYRSASPAWKIHAFIFRWNRQIMAGIVDDGETEGRHSFYAVKR